MPPLPTLLAASLLLSLPLTLLVSAAVAAAYRRTTLRLMRLGPPIAPGERPGEVSAVAPASPPATGAGLPPPALPSLLELLRRERRLWGSLAVLSVVVAGSGNALYLAVNGLEILPQRLLVVALVLGTPGLVLLMQLQRWTLPRQLAALALWLLVLVLLYAVVAVDRSRTAEALAWIVPQLLWPWAVFGLLYGVPALRALAPFLVLPVFLLVLLVQLGLQLLVAWAAAGFPGPLAVLVTMFGAALTVVGFGLLPLLLGGLPLARHLTRRLGQLYRRGLLSDLSYLFGSAWLLILLVQALPGWVAAVVDGRPAAPAALVTLLAWLWIPFFFAVVGPRWLSAARPMQADAPALLVLRTFRRPGPVGWLFDHVVQRWRLLGPVLLITAADLASRTLEPHELVDFLEGRLRRRYVADGAELSRQLAAVERQPDHDGRYRVSEFRCFDTTWKQALAALLARASVVLMDLRGFTAANAGCRHELERIAAASHLGGVVLLFDETTDRALAGEILGDAGPGPPLHWILAGGRRLARHAEVMAALTGRSAAPT